MERAPGRSCRWSNRAASVTAALETSSPAAGTLERPTNLGDCCSRKARSIQHRSNVARPRRTPRRHGCSLSHVHTCTSRERCSLAAWCYHALLQPTLHPNHVYSSTYFVVVLVPQQAVVQNWCSDADRKIRDQAPEQSRNKAPAPTEALASPARFCKWVVPGRIRHGMGVAPARQGNGRAKADERHAGTEPSSRRQTRPAG